MKCLPLVWSGIWRNRGRTLLIFLQIGVAFALFGVLQGMKTGVDQAIAKARADLLFVAPKEFGAPGLPAAYMDRIKSLPGVKAVDIENGFLTTYQKPTELVYALAIDPEDKDWLWVAPEIFKVTPEYLAALAKTRTGALVSLGFEKKYGWKIGDRIPLNSTTLQSNGSADWAFDIVGTFADHEMGSGGDFIVINNGYFSEARREGRGTARSFVVSIVDPKQAVAVTDAIDHQFANSSNETRTVSYRESAQLQMQRIGDLNFVIRAIISAVLVAILFSTSTMMMQTIRERTPELAVLKTLGFTDRAVLWLVMSEAMTVCVAAALFGLMLAMLVFPLAAKFVPGLSMPWVVVEVGLASAVVVALISAALPAARAANLQVAAALAGR
jgi:putative ABC transport system permease protein